MVDAAECLHLALNANSGGNIRACLYYLNEVLHRQPEHAQALYLLAAQHAELGLIDVAISEIGNVLTLDPGLEIARFHLGLMLLDKRRLDEARQCFAQVIDSADPTLRGGAAALLAFANYDLPAARRELTKALPGTAVNRSLLLLVQRLLNSTAAADLAAPA